MLARGPSTASAQAHAQRSLQRPKAFGCHVRERRTPAAAQVYESLARSGEVSEQELAYFDPEGGEDLLYGLRFLAIAQRPALARYMVAERMDASGPPPPPPPLRASGLACGGRTISCGSRRLPCQLRRGRAAAVARPKVCQASRAALALALGYAAAAVCQAARRQSQAGSGSPCRRLALPALGHATWSDAAQGV